MRWNIGVARRRVRSVVGAGVATVVVAGGGIAYAANSTGGSSPSTTSAPAAAPASVQAPTGGTGASANRTGRLRIAQGTITAIAGTTWTVRTPRGVSITVTVTSKTRFGTKATPSTASSFRVGSPIAMAGRRTGTTSMIARRIWPPKARRRVPTTSGATGARPA